MVVANQFFETRAGDNVPIQFTVTGVDLNSVDSEFLLGSNELTCNAATTALIRKQSVNGSAEIEIVSATVCVVTLLSADTDDLCGGYSWVLKTVTSGEYKTIAEGACKFKPKLGNPA